MNYRRWQGPDRADDPHAPIPTSSDVRLLEADARYARDRASLYRARAWSRKHPTSDQRMRQLENAAESAAARLQRARAAAGASHEPLV
jgi:hypothetical protein